MKGNLVVGGPSVNLLARVSRDHPDGSFSHQISNGLPSK